MTLNIVILGAPGAGKGTQAERLACLFSIPRISTGEVLRAAVREGTRVGDTVREVMKRGELVDDELMIEVVWERLSRADATAGCVLDGFPRTVTQALALDELFEGKGPVIVVSLDVPQHELVQRLSRRFVCADCGLNAESPNGHTKAMCRHCGGALRRRVDDDDTVVAERLRQYHRQTEPLLDYYRVRPTFRPVDGTRAPSEVTRDLANAIDACRAGVGPGGGPACRPLN